MKTASVLIVIAAIVICSAVSLGWFKNSAVAAKSLEFRESSDNDSSMEHQIVAKEREGLETLKTGNLEQFANPTADDAVFVDAMGPASKAQVVKNVAGFTLTDYSMDDIRYVPLSGKSGLITYKISEKGVSHGRQFEAHAYISSIWTKRGKGWLCLFSQETAAKQP
jgi:ketosteroid isomerase-like protein